MIGAVQVVYWHLGIKMNERIIQLYDQAIVIEQGKDYVCGELDPEKFAQLIIQDCTNIIANQGKFLGCVALEEKVKKHFGIDSPK